MKKIRSLPFGYAYRNGKCIHHPVEAGVVREIFEAYQQGESMAQIAAHLTARRIPYSEVSPTWNKNMVDRILSNSRYMGADGFLPIITADDFLRTKTIKEGKSRPQAVSNDSPIGIIRNRVACGECGARMTRLSERRSKDTVFWRCTCPTCRSKVTIADEALAYRITTKMNRIIKNPELLEDPDAYLLDEAATEARTASADELKRMCESGHYPDEQLLSAILESTRGLYDKCNGGSAGEVSQVALAYSASEPSEELDKDLFQTTIDCVLLNGVGRIWLRLTSGKEIA